MKYKLLIASIFLSVNIFAQSKETTQLFKKFVIICNGYKQLPLQLIVDYKKTSNMPLYKDDSTAMQGVFYLEKGAAYIKFGEAEQIVTDSLALIVMSGINQMLLSENTTDIAAKVNSMINMTVMDSSVKSFAERYTIQQKSLDAVTAVLEISNKQKVYGTEIPFEKIILTYNSKTNDPQKIETIKRGLIKKPAEGEYAATMITIPEKGEYLLKEDVTAYVYKTITHDANKKMPVILADRIVKDTANNYIPVKAYKNYTLIVN
jgi:hypothetical protein